MEISELKILLKHIADNRHDYLSPPEVYLSDKEHPKLLQFYKHIISGKIKTDEEAAELLLEKNTSSKEYTLLKNMLEERISVLVLGIDPEKALKAMASRNIFRSYRHLLSGYLLRSIPATFTFADDLFEMALKKGEFINDPVISFLSHYWQSETSSLKNKGEEFYEHKKQFVEALDIFKKESTLRLYESELNLIQSGSHMNQYRYVAKAKKYYEEAKKIHESLKSYTSYLSFAIIGMRYGFASKNYQLVIDMANLRDDLIKKNPQYMSNYLTAMSSTLRMVGNMYLRRYDEGKEEARNIIKNMKTGNRDWLAVLEYYFLLCMQSGNYEQALNIYYEATKNDYFKSLNPEYQERWKYFEPYLNFIIPDQFPKDFINLLGFLDEISYYTSHKGDNNIIVMVGQIIVMLDLAEFEKLRERTHYLETYIKKYVEKKIYPRTFIFLTMLLRLFKNNFDVGKTSKQIKMQYVKLMPKEGNKLFCIEDIEVIPYENLWDLIVVKLSKKTKAA